MIDRTDFDLRWNASLPGGGFLLADEVPLAASFSAVKALAPKGQAPEGA